MSTIRAHWMAGARLADRPHGSLRPRPGRAFQDPAGLGFVLAAVNPKNLLMCAAAGSTIAGGAVSGPDQAVLVVVFTAIAASTVLIPVIDYLAAGERAKQPLDELNVWLQQHNDAVMAVLVLVIGAALIGKCIGGLT